MLESYFSAKHACERQPRPEKGRNFSPRILYKNLQSRLKHDLWFQACSGHLSLEAKELTLSPRAGVKLVPRSEDHLFAPPF
jgi:hypothetical protein